MTRKDFELIAAALKAARTIYPVERADALQQSEDDAFAIANALAQDNLRFDRSRFLIACGVQ